MPKRTEVLPHNHPHRRPLDTLTPLTATPSLPLDSSRVTPSSRPSCRICWEAAEGVTYIASAAAVTVP